MKITEVCGAEVSQVNTLVSNAFGYTPPHAFFDDFPIWASSGVTRLGVFEKGKLISHVGVRFAEMKTRTRVEKIALIGAVATDPSFRGQGLSTSLLKEALTRIDQAKISWSLLWGSEHDFYAKLGFHLEGTQARAAISRLSLDTKNLLPVSVKGGLTEKIFQALQKSSPGVSLGEKDRSWLFSHKTIQWFYLDEPFAFIAYERGMDLKHLVHEFGGSAQGIQKLLYRIFSRDPLAEVIGTPESLTSLGFSQESLLLENLCLARPRSELQKWDSDFWVSGVSAC